MEWITVFLIFLMLSTEIVWSVNKIYISVKASIDNLIVDSKRKKALKKRRLERTKDMLDIGRDDLDNPFVNIDINDAPKNITRKNSTRHTRVESGFVEDSLRAQKINNGNDLEVQLLGE